MSTQKEKKKYTVSDKALAARKKAGEKLGELTRKAAQRAKMGLDIDEPLPVYEEEEVLMIGKKPNRRKIIEEEDSQEEQESEEEDEEEDRENSRKPRKVVKKVSDNRDFSSLFEEFQALKKELEEEKKVKLTRKQEKEQKQKEHQEILNALKHDLEYRTKRKIGTDSVLFNKAKEIQKACNF